MPYKRFSPTSDTFLVTHFEPDFGKTDFFNSHFFRGHLRKQDRLTDKSS